jgi:hypothetical protein
MTLDQILNHARHAGYKGAKTALHAVVMSVRLGLRDANEPRHAQVSALGPNSVSGNLPENDQLSGKTFGKSGLKSSAATYRNHSGATLEVTADAIVAHRVVLPLTPMERELLRYVLAHAPAVVSKEQLTRDVWKRRSRQESSVIQTTFSRMRSKLGTLADVMEHVDGGYRASCVPCDMDRLWTMAPGAAPNRDAER